MRHMRTTHARMHTVRMRALAALLKYCTASSKILIREIALAVHLQWVLATSSERSVTQSVSYQTGSRAGMF